MRLSRPGAATWRLILVSPLLALGAIYLARAHGGEARAVLHDLAAIPLWAAGAAFLLILLQLTLQSLRQWSVVPRPMGLGPLRVMRAFMLGEWLNMFAPARGGDVFRAVMMGRGISAARGGPATASGAGAVVADKVVDAAALVLLCAAGGLFGLLWTNVRTDVAIAAGIGLVAVAAWIWVRSRGGLGVIRAQKWAIDLAAGLTALRDPRRLAAGIALGAGGWVAEGLALWVLCTTLGVQPSPFAILLALVLLNVGVGVPLSFANLGVYEAAMAAGLRHAGLPLPIALAAAASHHGLELLASSLAAGIALLAGAPRAA